MAARRNAKEVTKFKVGDRVRVDFGDRLVPAVITEDRGNIGYGGRRLFAVRALVGVDPDIEMVYELPEVEIFAA
jgi:hypothetical protein